MNSGQSILPIIRIRILLELLFDNATNIICFANYLHIIMLIIRIQWFWFMILMLYLIHRNVWNYVIFYRSIDS